MNLHHKHAASNLWWLFTIALISWLVLPTLLDEGMFMDGVIYATLSRNLSIGLGSVWAPHFSMIPSPEFHDQPPLVFWLQSFFFRLFGDRPLAEEMYCLTVLLVSGGLLVALWKQVRGSAGMAWLPLVLWGCCPIVYMAYSNNLLECTLIAFALAALIFCIKGNQRPLRASLGWYMLSGIMLFGAAISKGPPALFPLAGVFLFWIVFRSFSFGEMLVRSAMLLLSTALCFVFLCVLFPPAYHSLVTYLDEQVLRSLRGEREAGSHFAIIRELLNDLITIFILTLLAYFVYRKKGRVLPPSAAARKWLFFFLLMALAASLPIMVSAKQMSFYAMPSFGFYALAAALYLEPLAVQCTEILSRRNTLIRWGKVVLTTALLICLVYSISCYGHPGRDADDIHDAKAVGKYLGWGAVVSVPNHYMMNYSTSAYFARYYNITLNYKMDLYRYFLTDSTYAPPEGYARIPLRLNKFILYKDVNRPLYSDE